MHSAIQIYPNEERNLGIKNKTSPLKCNKIGISESTRAEEVHFVSWLVNYLIYTAPESFDMSAIKQNYSPKTLLPQDILSVSPCAILLNTHHVPFSTLRSD